VTPADYARDALYGHSAFSGGTLQAIEAALAAAEERGRRAGIEERDELLRAALQSVEWVLPPQGETPAYCLSCGGAQPHHVPGCLIAAALAPRDSGKEDRK
jgi:hypothetical protein